MGDVGKWAPMNDCRRVRQRLNQVWLQSILKQNRNSIAKAQFTNRNWLLVIGVANHDF